MIHLFGDHFSVKMFVCKPTHHIPQVTALSFGSWDHAGWMPGSTTCMGSQLVGYQKTNVYPARFGNGLRTGKSIKLSFFYTCFADIFYVFRNPLCNVFRGSQAPSLSRRLGLRQNVMVVLPMLLLSSAQSLIQWPVGNDQPFLQWPPKRI